MGTDVGVFGTFGVAIAVIYHGSFQYGLGWVLGL